MIKGCVKRASVLKDIEMLYLVSTLDMKFTTFAQLLGTVGPQIPASAIKSLKERRYFHLKSGWQSGDRTWCL